MPEEKKRRKTAAHKAPDIQAISLPVIEQTQPDIVPLMQGPASNQLFGIASRTSSLQIDSISDTAVIRKSDEFELAFENFSQLKSGLKVSAHKLLDVCTLQLGAQNTFRHEPTDLSVVIPLDAYCRLLGKPETPASKDEMRKCLKRDLETLFSISLEYRGPNGQYLKTRLLSSQGFTKGAIRVTFAPDFARYLTSSYIMAFKPELLTVKENNPSTYLLGRRLLLDWSMNRTKHEQGERAQIISVKALLDSAPEIPKAEDINDGNYNRRIIAPFEGALDNIPFLQWEYCNASAQPLSDEQLKKIDIHTFLGLYVLYSIKEDSVKKEKTEQKSRGKLLEKSENPGVN